MTEHHEQIYSLLIKPDEITWQTIIYDLIKSEQMDPWNINISLLSKRYLETIKELEEHNFFISGKILLASAFLLKIKSQVFVDEHIANFDSHLFPQENDDQNYEQDLYNAYENKDPPPLLLKTPQPRKRKITINELMKALEKALDIDHKRYIKQRKIEVIREYTIPVVKIDIGQLMKNIYAKVINLFKNKSTITFTELLEADTKEEKIFTFIPLLHLENKGKLELHQEIPFGQIEITKGGV